MAAIALMAVVVIGVGAFVVLGGDSGGNGGANDESTGTVEITGDSLEIVDDLTDDPAVGTKAPEVIGEDFDGAEVTLGGSSVGTIAVIVAHWCPHCQAQLPVLVAAVDDGVIPSNVRVVAVSTSADESAPNFPPEDWFADAGWEDEILVDSTDDEVSRAYGASGFPFWVAIDSSGNVTMRASGELDEAGIEELVNSL